MSGAHAIPELDRRGLRRFAFTTAGIVVLLFALLLPWALGLGRPLWPWLVGAVLTAWGALAPGSLRPVYRGWMRFGLLMNRVTTPLVLGLIYFAVITPTALVMRLAGRDPLARRFERDAPSYRVRSAARPPHDMEKPY